MTIADHCVIRFHFTCKCSLTPRWVGPSHSSNSIRNYHMKGVVSHFNMSKGCSSGEAHSLGTFQYKLEPYMPYTLHMHVCIHSRPLDQAGKSTNETTVY